MRERACLALRHRRLRRRRQVHPHRPPALRHQVDLRGPARGGRAHAAASAATSTPTSPCSPTACAPSASRASPSTSPTATSPRRKRKFIIADTPGHTQYTRNMVTGASTADLALILIDARKGVLEQSRRHAFLSSLLGIPHLVVCVNKMDLVDWDQDRFEEIKAEFRSFAMKLDVHDLTFMPISALHGDNVVHRSNNSPWYEGSSLLHHLEEVHIASDRNLIDARFPVQYVIRPQPDQRRSPRLPGLRRHRGRRRVQAGRRGRGAAVGLHVDDRVASTGPGGVADRRGVPADGGHHPARRRHRRQPRRHDLPGPQPPPRRPGHRRHGLLADRGVVAASRGQVHDQAHDPLGARRSCRSSSTASTSTRCTATRRIDGAAAQRDRPGPTPHPAAAVLRRVPAQPHHRELHPHRRGTNATVAAGMILGGR